MSILLDIVSIVIFIGGWWKGVILPFYNLFRIARHLYIYLSSIAYIFKSKYVWEIFQQFYLTSNKEDPTQKCPLLKYVYLREIVSVKALYFKLIMCIHT